jgi:hypothetical protein
LLCLRLHTQLLDARPPQGKRGANTWRGTSNNVGKEDTNLKRRKQQAPNRSSSKQAKEEEQQEVSKRL